MIDACKILKGSESFERLSAAKGNVYVTGAAEGLKPLIISESAERLNKKAVIICENEIKAREFYNCLSLACENVYMYPAKDIVFYSADIKSTDIVKQRFRVLNAVFENRADFIVISAEGLFDKLTEPEIFKKNIIRLSEGEEINLEELSKRLVLMGYSRTSQVEGCGQFSVRGGIIDIFSPNNKNPVRIELWGDEIDTVRETDNYSQRSVGRLKEAGIYPFRELIYTEEELLRAAALIEKEDKETAERLREEKSFGGIERFINYFYYKTASIFDYLPHDCVVYLNEENKIRARQKGVYKEFSENVTERLEKGKALSREAGLIYSPEEIEGFLEKHRRIFINEFYDCESENTIDFKSSAVNGYGRNLEELSKRVKDYFDEDCRVLILASTTQNKRNIIKTLSDCEVSLYSDKYPEKNIAGVSKGVLPSFYFREKKLVVLNESGRKAAKKKRKRAAYSDTAGISSFSDLKAGDYVVHENHGIGIFRGIEQVEADGFLKDYLCIEYGEGGKLYVSVNQMELVQKYIGGDTAKLKLNSLGGASWAKTKAKARSAVKALAFDIVELYGKRQIKQGYKYSPDTVWQAEFEEAFPFEETEGQLEAVADIKRDMEKGKIMDRLICGDVGYGKTEVALRVAFKAICDGKQAAFLVPTTILANQHYMNIKERFRDYPINIEVLSRFKSQAEQKKTVERLKSGGCDFVVGTHRLLSEDIAFKNLGLVIVDEEQRFGVSHKEKLKRMTAEVDVLTLSATPIPRTLHMSLSGIRDMSVLNEPPEDRLPVQTYVMEYSEETVRTAILRELSQGGQVYYLHNRVQTIEEAAKRVRELVPEAVVGVGRGQMKERELERVIESFLNKDIDVLVCTTIIETGMDIQNVNTIIIEYADYMGLSQLYQLRGRVGRTNKQAFCYLTYKKDKIPSEVSEKRLKTIREFTEFGSGFKVALRDLEIRGAGDLLGANQHGHMDKIGYDMYCKILDRAIREMKGEEPEETVDTLIDISVNAFIPNSYISDEVQKLEMYKKISYIINKKDYEEVSDEFIDRFGEYPKAVENLMNIALLKEKARKLKITAVTGREHYVMFTFKQGADPDGGKILNLIREMRGRIQLTASGDTYLTYKTETKGAELIKELAGLIDRIF